MNFEYSSITTEAAQQDIEESFKWYNNQKKGLGNQFINRIRAKVARLKQNPFIFQIRYSQIRTAIIDQFPFLIHYYIDEIQKQIVVIAVLHTSKNPEIWNERQNTIDEH